MNGTQVDWNKVKTVTFMEGNNVEWFRNYGDAGVTHLGLPPNTPFKVGGGLSKEFDHLVLWPPYDSGVIYLMKDQEL